MSSPSHRHIHVMAGVTQKYLPLQTVAPLPSAVLSSMLSLLSPFPDVQWVGCPLGEWEALRAAPRRTSWRHQGLARR